MQMVRHHQEISVRTTATLGHLSIGSAAGASEECSMPLKFSAETPVDSALVNCDIRLSFF